MTQDEKWLAKYNEVKRFIETNHRNPSKHDPEEKYNYSNCIKPNRQLHNSGAMKQERVGYLKGYYLCVRSTKELISINRRLKATVKCF